MTCDVTEVTLCVCVCACRTSAWRRLCWITSSVVCRGTARSTTWSLCVSACAVRSEKTTRPLREHSWRSSNPSRGVRETLLLFFLLFCLCLFNFLSFMSHVLWRVAITGDLKNTLVKVLTLLKDAAESYSKVFLYIKLWTVSLFIHAII